MAEMLTHLILDRQQLFPLFLAFSFFRGINSHIKHREKGLQPDVPHVGSPTIASHDAGRDSLANLEELLPSVRGRPRFADLLPKLGR